MTYILLVIVQRTIGLRLDARAEHAGMDHQLHGEHGYGLLNLN
jgi:Amt family ammonium transporter